jgi:hypothetical protein
MNGQRTNRLTVGELFPARDIIAEWVFSVTALIEDIQVGVGPSKEAMEVGDLRAMMFWHRQLVTRLYEARRLVTIVRRNAAVKAFAESLLSLPSLIDVNTAYTRPSKGVPSPVEKLYSDVRHRTVHYSHVGQAELQAILSDHANYPAQMTIDRREDGAFDVQFQWVQAVRGRDVFGDVREDDFLTRLKKRGEMTGAITGAWIMAASLAVILNARRLNIDTERLGDISTWALPNVESPQPDPSGAQVPSKP